MTQPYLPQEEPTQRADEEPTQGLPEPTPSTSTATQEPIVIQVGNEQSSDGQVLAFNILNTMVGTADLRNAARPRRGPPTPEHVLICADPANNTISHILYFDQPHHPGDIVESFLNNTLNFSDPDEGFDVSQDAFPPPPPPTPSSSTEAVHGSSTETEVSFETQANEEEEDAQQAEGEEDGEEGREDHAR